MVGIAAAETAAALPTRTPTPSPTPIPYIGDIVLPEGTGTLYLEGDQWFFDSPLEAHVGKHVELRLHRYEQEDGAIELWLVPAADQGSPLFIKHGDEDWIKTMEYVEAKRPLVWAYGHYPKPKLDNKGQVLLNFEGWSEGGWYRGTGCFVARGDPYQEEDRIHIPAAIPLDGEYTSPMIPVDFVLNVRSNLCRYPSRAFSPGATGLLGDNTNIVELIKPGDVFVVSAGYSADPEGVLDYGTMQMIDLETLIERMEAQDSERAQSFREHLEQGLAFIQSFSVGRYSNFVLAEGLEVYSYDVCVGTGS